MTNHCRTWGHKKKLVGENRDDSSHQEDDEPDKESNQTNTGIYIYCLNVWRKILIFLCSMPSRSSIREYQPLRIKTYGSCTLVHQHIFELRGVTTSMLHRRWTGCGEPAD
ncbi:hypothetical protein TNCV_127991 [Trichonephila clavipes]|nr:hypothetical protein TNCV_127991 [Trichonephila clavipes]